MPRTDLNRLARVLAAAALTAQLGLLLAPGIARGHALLVDANPTPNSVIPASPADLVLFFSEAVDERSVSLRVVDAERRPVIGVGAPRLDNTGQVVSASLPELSPDTYSVEYAVVSAVDAHPTVSLFAFVVDPTGAAAPPSGPLPSETTAPPDPTSIAARWTATAAALVLAGSVLVWLLHRRRMGAESLPPPWLFLAATALVCLFGLLVYVSRATTLAFAGGHGHPGGFPLDPLAPFGWTPFAIAMRISLLGAVLALGTAVVAVARGPRDGSGGRGSGALLLASGAGAVGVILGLSLTGHVAALGGPVWGLVDAGHLLAVAAWLGALPAIAILARRSGQPGAAFGAHARVALVAAPLVVLTGLANSPLVVDDARELAAASYGNLLLVKAALVSLALGIGAANFFLARGGGVRRLISLTAAEVAVAAVAVLVGATMVSVPPAADRPPATIDPRLGVAHVFAEGGESTVHGIVNLPEPGVQSYSFAVSNVETGEGRDDIAQVTVTFIPPPASGLPSAIELAQPTQVPWIWSLRGAYTPVVGTWELDIAVHRGRLVHDVMQVPLDVRAVLRTLPLPPPTTGSQVLGILAAATAGLPPGMVAWAAPIALLGGGAVVLLVEFQRSQDGGAAAARGRRWIRWLRMALLAAGVLAGISLLARDAVAVANRAPQEWATATNPLADDPEAMGAGEELYAANCASCHGTDGAGDGPAVAGGRPPGDLAIIVPERTDGELGWTIAAGAAGTQMPAFGSTLLDGERWELVSYLRSRWPVDGP